MTTTAANRLEQLKSDIEARQSGIEEMRKQYAEMLTACDEDAADKVAAQIRNDEAKLSILKDRLPVLDELAAQEAEDARAAEAARLTQEANKMQTEIQAHFAKAAKLAAQLNQAVLELDENMALKWSVAAREARKAGGNPDRKEISVRDLFDPLSSAKTRMQFIAQAHSQGVINLVTNR